MPAGILLLAAAIMEAFSDGGRLHESAQLPVTNLRAATATSDLEIQEDRSTGGFVLFHLNRADRHIGQEWYLMLREAKEAAKRQCAVEESDWREAAETSGRLGDRPTDGDDED